MEYIQIILKVLKEKNYRMAFKLDKSGLSRKSDNKYLIERVGINSKTSFNTFKRWLLKEIIMWGKNEKSNVYK